MVEEQVVRHTGTIQSSPKPVCGFLERIFHNFRAECRGLRQDLVVALLIRGIQKFHTRFVIVFLLLLVFKVVYCIPTQPKWRRECLKG